MKKHLSVFMLYLRANLYHTLLLLLVLAAAEGLSVYFALQQSLFTLEAFFSNSGLVWAFGAAFLLLSVRIATIGCEFGSKQGYTLCRLQVSEKSVFFWQSLSNLVCYSLLLSTQLLLSLIFCRFYARAAGADGFTNQSVFLAFYRSEFLHGLLPMENLIRWFSNALLLIALSLGAAHLPYRQRRGKFSLHLLITASVCMLSFQRALGSIEIDTILILFALVPIGAILYSVLSKEAEDEA